MTGIAPKAERVGILADMLTGFTHLHTMRPNLWVESPPNRWDAAKGVDITVRQTDGFTMTLDTWYIRMYETELTVNITWNGASIDYTNPMDALVWLHREMLRH